MPSSRRMRVTVLLGLLALAVVFYVTTGPPSTQNSAFYQRTLAALKEKQSASAREAAIAEVKHQQERVARLREEHDAAIEIQQQQAQQQQPAVGQDGLKPAVLPAAPQRPITPQQPPAPPGEKSVAGRKKMKDDKVVQGKPDNLPENDGVARVGNISPQPSNVVHGDGSGHTEEDHKVEQLLNDILKKSPMIIFSKSYCPYSKKAKHILLDLYDISPKPYVVELDQAEYGSELQTLLETSTGRRTVPNVLINAKSIGGGDDIEALHNKGTLTETVLKIGSKRIVKADKRPVAGMKREVPFQG